jgi:hypothetical protein
MCFYFSIISIFSLSLHCWEGPISEYLTVSLHLWQKMFWFELTSNTNLCEVSGMSLICFFKQFFLHWPLNIKHLLCSGMGVVFKSTWFTWFNLCEVNGMFLYVCPVLAQLWTLNMYDTQGQQLPLIKISADMSSICFCSCFPVFLSVFLQVERYSG